MENPDDFQSAQLYSDNYNTFSSPVRERHLSDGTEFWNSYQGMEEVPTLRVTTDRDWQNSLESRKILQRKSK